MKNLLNLELKRVINSTWGTFEKGYNAGYNEAIKEVEKITKKLEKTND